MNNQKAVKMLKIFIVVKTGSAFFARIPPISTICSNYFQTIFVNKNNSHLLLLWLMVEVALPGGTDKVGKVAGTELEVKKVVSEMFATSCQKRYY